MEKEFLLSGCRIGIFGKGGAGKSTCIVLLAKALRRQGYTVCILDADSTNVGLAKALGVEKDLKQLVEYFGGMVFSGGALTCPVDDPSPLEGKEIDLEMMPSEYVSKSDDGIYFLSGGKLADKGTGAGCDGPIVKIARDLCVRAKGPTVLLVDFKAGFEDTARGAIVNMDLAVMVIDPTVASLEMAVHMKALVEEIQNGGLPATAHLEDQALVEIANLMYQQSRIKSVINVLNKIKDDQTKEYLKNVLESKNINISGVIYENPDIALAWMQGGRVENNNNEIDEVVKSLEKAHKCY